MTYQIQYQDDEVMSDGRLAGSYRLYMSQRRKGLPNLDKETLSNNKRISHYAPTEPRKNKTQPLPRGICFSNKSKHPRYMVRISVKRERLNVGTFDTIKEAVDAREVALSEILRGMSFDTIRVMTKTIQAKQQALRGSQ